MEVLFGSHLVTNWATQNFSKLGHHLVASLIIVANFAAGPLDGFSIVFFAHRKNRTRLISLHMHADAEESGKAEGQ